MAHGRRMNEKQESVETALSLMSFVFTCLALLGTTGNKEACSTAVSGAVVSISLELSVVKDSITMEIIVRSVKTQEGEL